MNKIKFQISRLHLPSAKADGGQANFKFQILEAGFSLIELLVVAAIITTLLAIGVSALVTYSNAQTFNSRVAEMVTTLETAKTYAQSQVKKCVTSIDTFDGYSVIIATSTTYTLNALCRNGTTTSPPNTIDTKTLQTPLTVGPIGTTVTFDELTGGASGGSITITGYNRCQTVRINAAGNITVDQVRFLPSC